MKLGRTATASLALAGLAAPAALAQDPTPSPSPTPTPTPTSTKTPRPHAVIQDSPEDLGSFEVTPKPDEGKPKPTPSPSPEPTPTRTPKPEPTAKPDRPDKKPRPDKDDDDKPAGKHKPKPGGEADGVPGPPADWSSLPAARVSAAALDAFRIPPFLLPIYQAAGIQYGVRWEVLAAINEIETDNGRNLNVSSAGALGWMQFMPSSWAAYGVDANRDGLRDPYNPVDAIFAAARYLKAAGAQTDLAGAVFAYNHADWYVADVLQRAREIAALPTPLVGALTGLAQGRVPVAAPVRFARKRESLSFLRMRTRANAQAIAVADGRVTRLGHSKRLGNYVELQDTYGNLYTYAQLGSVAETHPVPRRARPATPEPPAAEDAAPELPATAGKPRRHLATEAKAPERAAELPRGIVPLRPLKERLFAHPGRKHARAAGGVVQIAQAGYASNRDAVLKLNKRDYRAKPLTKGSRILAGTVLGRIGEGLDPHLRFEIRPAGKGAPAIDPAPIVDGWKLLQSTAVYRDAKTAALPTLGQALLLGKQALQEQVLADPRLSIYECGRRDIRIGAIDRRVLATLEFLAAQGMNPAVSSLRCGHGFFTSSGNVSEHSTGTAVDISAINGTSILGNQGPGSITDRAVRALLTLQGPMQPHQIITLMDYEGAPAAFSMSDHADHIHVGFRPEATERGGTAGGAPMLAAGQWPTLVRKLAAIEQPKVPTRPSRYALRARVRLPQG